MSHFIKLTANVINKLHISHITQWSGKYYIYMRGRSINGWNLLSFGNIWTNQDIIEICEKKNKNDYDIITKFIEEIK